ncbi:methyl-accepting chemotaxis protein [Crenobacter cavernae]|nr:methyl-accepting chemotaxis protein [Crenobacter cavernae]
MTLRGIFTVLTAGGVALMTALGLTALQLNEAATELELAEQSRYHSYLLADELRQSSDELTRMARTYAVTGDARYEQQYLDVLAIRDGKKPRPEGYERIYWDFIAAGEAKPRPDGETVSLQTLLERAGVTEAEFAKLRDAQARSDALVKTETVALNAVKGRFDDGKGGFTRTGEPDLALAQRILHDAGYHRTKAEILRPLDAFFALLSERTAAQVAAAQAHQAFWMQVVVGLIVLTALTLALSLMFAYRKLMTILGDEPQAVSEQLREIAAGRLDGEIRTKRPNSVLGVLAHMQAELAGMIGGIRRGSDQLRETGGNLKTLSSLVAEGCAQQAQSTTEIAAAVEELAVGVAEMAGSAENVERLTGQAQADVSDGAAQVSGVAQKIHQVREVVLESAENVRALGRESEKISAIVDTIRDVADQTSLLALNAAIEAARAGEQGRGFAVVADEVRRLAERTEVSTREITEMVQAIQSGVQLSAAKMEQAVVEVEAGNVLSGQVEERLQGIQRQSADVLTLVQGITLALVEQKAAGSEIARNVEHIVGLSERSDQGVRSIDDNVDTLNAVAHGLHEAVARFKLA